MARADLFNRMRLMKQTPDHSLVLAAETPQYFPALAYFHKVARADIFVLGDDLQFSKHAFINRCRIKTANGAQWLTVPVRTQGRFGQKINAVEILENNDWRHKHWQALVANYCRAAYFEKYAHALESLFQKQWENLAGFNLALLQWVCGALQINCRLVRSSALSATGRGSERLLAWLKELEGNAYLCDNHEGELLELEKFEEAGVAVKISEFAGPIYHQQFGEFIPHLSILDLILNEGEESRKILTGV